MTGHDLRSRRVTTSGTCTPVVALETRAEAYDGYAEVALGVVGCVSQRASSRTRNPIK
jgi:hypothetical protein